ncbi:MAG: cupin domain-containing protein [Deltaproteobacteria bacterium]|nr:cupin domain-containing protein [Deltaproteobacteria bacterium]
MDVFKDVNALVTFAADKMKKVNIFDTERMFCDVYCFQPNQVQTGHAHHGSDKVYYVLHGTAEIRIGQETRLLGPGHAALAPSGIEHAVRNPGADRSTVLVFMAPKP